MERLAKKDVNGTPLRRGDKVRYLGVSETYFADLPKSDQRAIQARIGKLHVIEGFSAFGFAELEWRVTPLNSHSIWVPGSSLEKVANKPKGRVDRVGSRQPRARLRK